ADRGDGMILEVALLKIKPGEGAGFERAFPQAEKILVQAKGHLSHELRRCIETPDRYLLLVKWETLADHSEGFRGSPLFKQWRAVIGPFFDGTPAVEHYEELRRGAAA
ncbi:MAG: antibiotic biosynthesis monooxygenase family protein, partial [Burkholderiales bacterium]